MVTRPLFVTQVYEASIAAERGFDAFRGELAEACDMLAAEDKAGRAWCKANAYGGYTSYASLNDLPQRASVFGALKAKLDKHVAAFARDLQLDLGGGKLKMDSLWVNILKPGAAHSGHIHPHSVISGTIYVETPPGAGALKLEDPRLPMMMASPPRLDDCDETAKTFVYLKPSPGTVFLWESWLRHEVVANAAKTERVSVSFNYAWR
ncbi:MAG: hypothetical protein CFE28_07160 [Alphaproteobacteria bacterium PA2]|nr:MAG: hypothetical protein CFE28_07160 [Alphaproteobacteria bacterium PA2]